MSTPKDWDENTPADTPQGAVKYARMAVIEARESNERSKVIDQRTLDTHGIVLEIKRTNDAIMVPRGPRSQFERTAMTAAALVVAACGLLYLARIAMAMP